MQKKIIPIAGAALILGAGLKTLFKSDKTYKSNQELLLEGKLRGYTIFLETLKDYDTHSFDKSFEDFLKVQWSSDATQYNAFKKDPQTGRPYKTWEKMYNTFMENKKIHVEELMTIGEDKTLISK
jgi:hypothetical protein